MVSAPGYERRQTPFGTIPKPVGRKAPLTPWGKIALGKKTRNNNKKSTDLIIRRVND